MELGLALFMAEQVFHIIIKLLSNTSSVREGLAEENLKSRQCIH